MQTSVFLTFVGKPFFKECTLVVTFLAFCAKFIEAVALVMSHVLGPKIPEIDLTSLEQKARFAFLFYRRYDAA
jgi:hypothetical protein